MTALLLLLLAQAPTAVPAVPGLDVKESEIFRRYDRNLDNKISEDEYRNVTVKHLYHTDKNKDGHLDASESTLVKQLAAKQPSPDGKSRLSSQDYQHLHREIFLHVDKNNDKSISPQEFKAWHNHK